MDHVINCTCWHLWRLFLPNIVYERQLAKAMRQKTAVGFFSGQHSASPAPPLFSVYLLKLPFSIFMYVHVLHFKRCSSWFSCTESCGLLIAGLVLMGFTWMLAFPRQGCGARPWFQPLSGAWRSLAGWLSQARHRVSCRAARCPAGLSPSPGQRGGLRLSLAA